MRLFRGDGSMRTARAAAGARRIRAPHHTSSVPSIQGRLYKDREDRLTYMPGEIGLAQGGMLILHDLPEFQRVAIEAVAEALREGAVILWGHGTRHTTAHRPQLVRGAQAAGADGAVNPSDSCKVDSSRRFGATPVGAGASPTRTVLV